MQNFKSPITITHEFEGARDAVAGRMATDLFEFCHNIQMLQQVFPRLCMKIGICADYAEQHRDNDRQIEEYYGAKTTGRCLQMIDYEHRSLRPCLLQDDLVSGYLECLKQFSEKHVFFTRGADFSLDAKGRESAAAYFAASEALNAEIAAWASEATAVIENTYELHEWQNQVLLNDADKSYGAYEQPVAENEMDKVMSERAVFFSEIRFHHFNMLMLSENIDVSFQNLAQTAAVFAREADLNGDKVLSGDSPQHPGPCKL